MSGMEFEALHARNIPAYINLSHNDPAATDNIPRTWAPVAHGRGRKEGRKEEGEGKEEEEEEERSKPARSSPLQVFAHINRQS